MKPAPSAGPANMAAQWRREFDAGFARAAAAAAPLSEDFLAIVAGAHAYALRLGEIAALLPCGELTPWPGQHAALLGLSGHRGAVLPVYALGALLGHGPAQAPPRWLVVAKRAALGLAFDGFDGHLRLDGGALSRPAEGASCHVADTLHCADGLRPVLAIDSLLAQLRANLGAA